MGNNFCVFANAEKEMQSDVIIQDIKTRCPEICFPEDPRLQCVFPISREEYIARDQKTILVRIGEMFDRLLAEQVAEADLTSAVEI